MKNSECFIPLSSFEGIDDFKNNTWCITMIIMASLLEIGVRVLKVWPEPKNDHSDDPVEGASKYNVISLDEEGHDKKLLEIFYFRTAPVITASVIIYTHKKTEWGDPIKTLYRPISLLGLEQYLPNIAEEMK